MNPTQIQDMAGKYNGRDICKMSYPCFTSPKYSLKIKLTLPLLLLYLTLMKLSFS